MSEHPIDPDAPPTEEEIRDSERLRDALEDPTSSHAEAELLRAVKSASAPAALDEKTLDSAVASGLQRFDASKRRSGIVIRVAFGAGFLAAAAALIVLIGQKPPKHEHDAMARARSTQSLFTERFESRGGESARIDRIAVARASDLRENRYARWGVR